MTENENKNEKFYEILNEENRNILKNQINKISWKYYSSTSYL
jgi:hypothetical protein